MSNPVVVGGALVVLNEAKSLAEDSDIRITAQAAEKEAPRIDEEDNKCEDCPVSDPATEQSLPRIRYVTLATRAWTAIKGFFGSKKKSTVADVGITGRWRHNGCDIGGATFYIQPDSTTHVAHNSITEAEVLPQNLVRTDSGCENCCKKGVAIEWKVEMRIERPIQSPGVHTAFPVMKADGTFSDFTWKK